MHPDQLDNIKTKIQNIRTDTSLTLELRPLFLEIWSVIEAQQRQIEELQKPKP